MSYVRWGSDGSDVYVYLGGQLVCCGCALEARDGSASFATTDAMIEHLRAHVAAGHCVPDHVIPDLEADRVANDYFIATGDERYLDGVCGEPAPVGEGRCVWPTGHRPRIYGPGVARDGRGHEVAHSWAEPPLWPKSMWVGEITEAP